MTAPTPRAELCELIAATLRQAEHLNLGSRELAELIAKQFHFIADEWTTHDVSTYGEDRNLRQRYLVAKIGRESQSIPLNRANREVAR